MNITNLTNFSNNYMSTTSEVCKAIHDDLLRQFSQKIPYIIFAIGLLVTIMMISQSFYLVRKGMNKEEISLREIIAYIWLMTVYAMSLWLVFAIRLF